MNYYYPALDSPTLKNINVVRRLMAEHPTYLTAEDCPYPREVIEWLEQTPLSNPQPVQNTETKDLEQEADQLYNDLKALRPALMNVVTNEGNKESIDYVKIATSLLERVLTIKERAAHIRDVDKFRTMVVEFMQDVLTPEQRTNFMDKVQKLNADLSR